MTIQQLCNKVALSTSTILELSQDYDVFDIIVFLCEATGGGYTYIENKFHPTNSIATGDVIGVTDDNTYEWFTVTNKRQFTYLRATSAALGRMIAVYGIKI